MSNYGPYGIFNHKCSDDSILTFKIYDKCKLKECDNYGPAISAEPCECIILDNSCYTHEFGRFILPGRPITLSKRIFKAKICEDSFHVTSVNVQTEPAQSKCGFWTVDVKIKYEFNLMFFDKYMCPLKIKFLGHHDKCKDVIKDSLRASVCTSRRYMLYGGKCASPITATDLCLGGKPKAGPHALVEFKSFPLGAEIIDVRDCGCGNNVYDSIYEETIRYIYVTIGTYMLIFLFRIVSMMIEGGGFAAPREYSGPIESNGYTNSGYDADSDKPYWHSEHSSYDHGEG